jgi:hypothetical protein
MVRHADHPEEKTSMVSRPPESFNSETVATLREVLNIAIEQIAEQNRTPATKAKMAEMIVRSAADGVTDANDLVLLAVREGEVPAA